MRVQRISAAQTLNLRAEVLRPHHPLMNSVYSGDDGPQAGHFGVYDGEILIAVGTVVPELCVDPRAMPL